jgi:hypothetical protein
MEAYPNRHGTDTAAFTRLNESTLAKLGGGGLISTTEGCLSMSKKRIEREDVERSNG